MSDYTAQRRQEMEANITAMRHLAAQVAAALTLATGEPWSAEPPTGDNWHDENYARLNNAAGRSFTLHRDRQRVQVCGRYPSHPTGGSAYSSHDNPPVITIGPTRPAAAIAKDLARRFLPGFHALWEKVEGRIASEDRRIIAREAAAASLQEILGGKPYQHGGRNSDIYLSVPGEHGGKFQVQAADYIWIELRVRDLDTARRIAMILAD